VGRKRKPRKNKGVDAYPRPTSVQVTGPTLWYHRAWSKVVGAILAVLAIIAIPPTFATFFTKFDVAVGGTLNAQDPFQTSFVVTNAGMWTVNEPKIVCLAHQAEFDIIGDVRDFTLPPGNVLEQRVYRADGLRTGEKATIVCQPPMMSPRLGALRRGDIRIHISYRLWPLRYRKQTSFRFVAERGADSVWQWWARPVPANDPAPVSFPGFP